MDDKPAFPAPLTGSKLIFAALLLAGANFIAVLDTSIANVSVPNIAGGLAVSPNQGTWVITSYAVAEAITVPLTGWLAQRFGAIRAISVAMVMFGLFSLLCGFADTLGLLVVARILQGLAGGPMMPLSQTLMLSIFPREKAATATTIWSMTTIVGPIAGPILGGEICDNFGWSWIFFINVPVALLCGLGVWTMMRRYEGKLVRNPIDLVGLTLLIVWVGALQIMLDKGKDLDWFGSSFIVSLALVAVIGFIAFVIWELTEANPIVNLRIFRHRGFTIAVITTGLTYGAFFAALVLGPLWMQTNMGYTASDAGLASASFGMTAIVVAPFAARVVQKFDPRIAASLGIFGTSVAILLRIGFNTDITFGRIMLINAAVGLFMPFFFISALTLTIRGVDRDEIPSASGLSSFMRSVSGAFGTSLVQTGWDDATKLYRSELAGLVQGLDRLHGVTLSQGMSKALRLGELSQIVDRQSLMLATNRMYLLIATGLAVSASIVWLAPKMKAPTGPLPPAH